MLKEIYKVLVVDDSEDERFLLRRSLQRIPDCEVVGMLSNGEAAIAYLKGTGVYQDRRTFPFPTVLLLDFNMRRMGGLEVLGWLQGEKFPDLCTIMVSNSFQDGDVEKSLLMGANHCLEKADPIDDAAMIEECLKNLVKLPQSAERERMRSDGLMD